MTSLPDAARALLDRIDYETGDAATWPGSREISNALHNLRTALSSRPSAGPSVEDVAKAIRSVYRLEDDDCSEEAARAVLALGAGEAMTKEERELRAAAVEYDRADGAYMDSPDLRRSLTCDYSEEELHRAAVAYARLMSARGGGERETPR